VSCKRSDQIANDAPRAHFLSTKIYWAVKELLEANTVLYDHEVNAIADGVQDTAKSLLSAYYKDGRRK
jgi:hypothetical protein